MPLNQAVILQTHGHWRWSSHVSSVLSTRPQCFWSQRGFGSRFSRNQTFSIMLSISRVSISSLPSTSSTSPVELLSCLWSSTAQRACRSSRLVHALVYSAPLTVLVLPFSILQSCFLKLLHGSACSPELLHNFDQCCSSISFGWPLVAL